MNSEVVELKRPAPKQGLADFLDTMSEDELLAQLDAPMEQIGDNITPEPFSPLSETFSLETNTRLTIIKMMEQVPEMGRPFTFHVRRYCGDAYIQAMRTTLARARRWARENNHELDEQFRMVKMGIETRPNCDVVTVMRVPKGKKVQTTLEGLARVLGGSHIEDDED